MRLPILVIHICAGILGLLSGTAAMSFRKGSRGHRLAGNVFVLSMLIMAAAAVPLAILKSQVTNIIGGILTFYLIGTAWQTAKRKDGETGIFDWVALLFALALGGTLITFGLKAAHSPTGLKYGYPAGFFFTMGSVVLIAATGDVRLLLSGGISGRQRIARHLWRMCLGLFFATGSLFLGQQQVFPAFLRGSNVLLIPAFLPLVLLIYWLIRVRFPNAYQRTALPRQADAHSVPA
jgi:hypothetical protein